MIPDLDTVRDVAERIFGEKSSASAGVGTNHYASAVPHFRGPATVTRTDRPGGAPASEAAARTAVHGDAGALLRSPYLPGWDDEADARALLEVELRRRKTAPRTGP